MNRTEVVLSYIIQVIAIVFCTIFSTLPMCEVLSIEPTGRAVSYFILIFVGLLLSVKLFFMGKSLRE